MNDLREENRLLLMLAGTCLLTLADMRREPEPWPDFVDGVPGW